MLIMKKLLTHEASYKSSASAGKAPRRRVHSLSGIAAIAECGLPPPRIVIGYPAHQAQSGAEPFLSFLAAVKTNTSPSIPVRQHDISQILCCGIFRPVQHALSSCDKSACGTKRINRTALKMSVDWGKPECAGRPARSRWCKSITMKE